jgi:branched-chain amino acid aminotransferase
MSKAAANYMNSQLIRMEASFNGFAEGIALDSDGHVSEGSGMNIFLAHDGTLYTPPLASSILPGITRDAVMKIAEDLRILGKGVAGPITRKLQEEFFAITSGTKPDRHNWLTPVGAPVGVASR